MLSEETYFFFAHVSQEYLGKDSIFEKSQLTVAYTFLRNLIS